MLKSFAFLAAISFALLCLSNCGNSEPSKESNNLEAKCLEHIGHIINKKTFVEEEFAVLTTDSNGKTHVHLNEIVLNCAASQPGFEISHVVDNDTLKLNESYTRGLAKCSCNSSLDLTIESIGDGIKYLVYTYEYTEGNQSIFPVKYE